MFFWNFDGLAVTLPLVVFVDVNEKVLHAKASRSPCHRSARVPLNLSPPLPVINVASRVSDPDPG